ncbi:MAG: GNAT family N-acetyltransferase [Betaproteobacteria bacterium]
MHIRAYRPADESAIVRLWTECGLTRSWNDPHKDIARKLTVQADLFLAAERCRRRGLARRLMAHIEEKLLAMGCPKLNIQVRMSNSEALIFYERLGYAPDQAVTLGKRLIRDA